VVDVLDCEEDIEGLRVVDVAEFGLDGCIQLIARLTIESDGYDQADWVAWYS
jgi:hypothetical protein